MFRLIPKEESFFDLFERAAGNAHEAATLLVDFLDKFDDLEERAKRIHDLEIAGNELTHETVLRLNRTFVTPLDREDIHELICRLDDIVDLIDEAVSRTTLYAVEVPTKEACTLAQCIRHATGILVEAMPLLRNTRNAQPILQKCAAVHVQETEADLVERHALASLFKNRHEPLHIIRWKDIYADLETASDKCEDVADVLEGIVVKNA